MTLPAGLTQKRIHLGFCCTEIFNGHNKELQLHSDCQVGRFSENFATAARGLSFLSQSMPSLMLTPLPLRLTVPAHG
jgi:hypothetical protein